MSPNTGKETTNTPEQISNIVEQTPNRVIQWWSAELKSYRTFYTSMGDTAQTLRESVKLFSDSAISFDLRAVGVFTTLAVFAGASGYCLRFAIDESFTNFLCCRTFLYWLANGTLFYLLFLWIATAKYIVEAYYTAYVCAALDSTKKHAAFGVANHIMHKYILDILVTISKKADHDSAESQKYEYYDKLIFETWLASDNTMFSNYSTFLNTFRCISYCIVIISFFCSGLFIPLWMIKHQFPLLLICLVNIILPIIVIFCNRQQLLLLLDCLRKKVNRSSE